METILNKEQIKFFMYEIIKNFNLRFYSQNSFDNFKEYFNNIIKCYLNNDFDNYVFRLSIVNIMKHSKIKATQIKHFCRVEELIKKLLITGHI